jgi:uncharacterized protein Smg (DUF494 family)
MGKAAAHTFVEKACKAALKEKVHLKAYLLEKTDILTQITEGVSDVGFGMSDVGNASKSLDALFDAKNAIGMSDEVVGQFISRLALQKMDIELQKTGAKLPDNLKRK